MTEIYYISSKPLHYWSMKLKNSHQDSVGALSNIPLSSLLYVPLGNIFQL